MAGRFSNPNQQFFDGNGDPLSGGKLSFFESGTSTPLDTYSDDGLTVPNTNPVILNDAGRARDIFLTGADYKVELKEADDTVVWTADPVRSPTPKSTAVRAVSTGTQLDQSDDGTMIIADATGGAFLVTLPPVADVGNGFEVTVMKVDTSANEVTVDGSGSETINGVSDLPLSEAYASAVFRTDGTTWYAYAITQTASNRILPPKYINGFLLTNNSTDSDHDIDISPGSARDVDDGGNITRSASITKRIDAAFAEGNNQGGLDTGSTSPDTVYFLWAIGKQDGTADVLFSLSDTAPTLPSGFTLKRRIGAVMLDDSENIHNNQFRQVYPGFEEYTAERQLSSGTEADFIGLPSGVELLQFGTDDLARSASEELLVQIGPSSGVETTGYVGAVGRTTGSAAAENAWVTSGVTLERAAAAADTASGTIIFQRGNVSSNSWSVSGAIGNRDVSIGYTGGRKELAGEIERVRVTITGAATFTGGSASVRARVSGDQ